MFTCTECNQTFTLHSNLRRHVKQKHEHLSVPSLKGEPSQISSEQSAAEKKFACTECNQTFTLHSNLRRHVKVKHEHSNVPSLKSEPSQISREQSAAEKKFACTECNQTFTLHKNLRTHVMLKHKHSNVPSLKSEPSQLFTCSVCSKNYWSSKSLQEHMKKHDGDNIARKQCDQKLACPLKCSQPPSSRKEELVKHLKEYHNLRIKEDSTNFNSFGEFLGWKRTTERISKSCFVIHKRNKGRCSKTHYFQCHRSGNFVSKSKGVRHMKTQGTNKINAICPASITVKEDIVTGKCDVSYVSTHVGHDNDLGHLPLRCEERESLAMKLAAQIPYDAILNELRRNILDVDRLQLVTKKDLNNIEAAFNLSHSERRHKADGTSVHAWVEEMKESSNAILFYKAQDEEIISDIPLKKEDFVLIVMNEGQKEMFEKYGKKVVCIDGTHGMNSYNFEMITVLVLDDFHEGFPVAFMFSNRSDENVVSILCESIKKIIGVVQPEIFMSDMADAFYNSWKKVMGPVEKRLFCTWHVIKAWRQNLNDKIKCVNKREEVRQEITAILEETDVGTFERLLELSLNKMLNDPEKEAFGKYFRDNYANRQESWAYCHRLWCGLNTNMHLEAMHKTLKYFYLYGRKVNRLDKGIHAMMRFIRDKMFERIIALEKGKIPSKLKVLRARHKLSEQISSDVVIYNEDSWYVPSQSVMFEYYTVKKSEKKCRKCNLVCQICRACIHQYRCTCVDNSIKWNMCKHIHVVCQYLRSLSIPPSESSEDEMHMEIQNLERTLTSHNECNPEFINTLEETKEEIRREVNKMVDSISTPSQAVFFREHISKIPPTLLAIENQIGIFSGADVAAVPPNRKIEPQRRLFSTKKSKRKNIKYHKLDGPEKRKIALAVILEGQTESNQSEHLRCSGEF